VKGDPSTRAGIGSKRYPPLVIRACAGESEKQNYLPEKELNLKRKLS